MNMFGTLPSGAFATETHNANDPTVSPQVSQYGSIYFTDSLGTNTSLDYTGLQPINDTAPATLYTFNDFADDQSFTAQDGPPVLGFATLQFVNTPVSAPPTFETTNIANKTNVVFNTPFDGYPRGHQRGRQHPGSIDRTDDPRVQHPTGGDDSVTFTATPAGVATSLVGSSDQDVTNVSGLGVAAGTTLVLNGGASTNTLNYDAGGLIPTFAPGLLPGEVLITIPGAGTVDAINYQQINITDSGGGRSRCRARRSRSTASRTSSWSMPWWGHLRSPSPASSPRRTTRSSRLSAGRPCRRASRPATSPRRSSGATAPPSAGTIVQDASDPSVYDIEGTHTYTNPGTFPIGLTINLAIGSVTGTLQRHADHIQPAGRAGGGNIRDAPRRAGCHDAADGRLGLPDRRDRGRDRSRPPPIASFIDAGGSSGSADPASDFGANHFGHQRRRNERDQRGGREHHAERLQQQLLGHGPGAVPGRDR